MVVLLTNPFCTSTVIIKQQLIKRYRFSLYPELLAAEDWYIWIRILRNNLLSIKYESSPLTSYRWVEDSMSGRDIYRCDLQAIVVLSILYRNGKIHAFMWILATFVRLLRIFFKRFFGYEAV